jgi:hypothetical protein
MSDPDFELPAHPNLEYYRKQAKHLQRSYETGDAAARARCNDCGPVCPGTPLPPTPPPPSCATRG